MVCIKTASQITVCNVVVLKGGVGPEITII